MDTDSITPARPPRTGDGKKRKPLDLIGIALRRAVLVGLCGTSLGLFFALILYPMGSPVYRTSAVMVVDPSKQPTVNGRDRSTIPGDLRDWTRTQLSRLMSAQVMHDAIERVPVVERPDFLREKPDSPANPFRLMKRIDAREVQGTYLVELRIENGDPAGIAEVLNAVMESFLNKLRRETEQAYTSRLTYLREERKKIAERLRVEEEALQALAGAVENKAFLHEGYNAHLTKVDQIQRLYWEAFTRETQAKAMLEKVLEDKQAFLEMSLQPFADERVADNFGINRIEQWTYEQLQQMRASIDGLTEENEDRKYVESRMEAMNRYLAEYKERVKGETIANLQEKRLFELEREEQMARSASEAAEKSTRILYQRLTDAREQAGKISLAIFQASSPSLARDQLQERLQALASRIDDAEMLAKAPVPVSIDQRAGVPSSPSSTSNLKLALAGFVLGFGLVGGVVVLYELLDDRIRTSREIRLALGGDCPDAIPESTDFGSVLLENPEHPSASVIRDLATRLYRDHQHYGGTVYVVSGLESGVGATSVSVNLARALRELEGPVLLLELDLEHPGIRETLRLSPGEGVESFLGGSRTLEQVLRKDEEGRLDVLAVGESGRPADLSALQELLPGLREDYALIVVDAGPIHHDVALLAAQRADGVVLVAQWKSSRYGQLRRAIDRLVHQETTAVTALLNRSPKPEQAPIQAFLAGVTGWISRRASRIQGTLLRRRKKA